MDCYLMTFNPKADPSYKLSKSDRLIMLRSKETHTEFRFSPRYRGVSASATMADKCRCFRFKMIDYKKHPLRWKIDVVHLTDSQEDDVFREAVKMAGLENMPMSFHIYLKFMDVGGVIFGKNALKYDLAGVSISFIIPKWRLWRPHKDWVFCSESCCILLKVAFDDFIPEKKCDEQTPSSLRKEWRKYNHAA